MRQIVFLNSESWRCADLAANAALQRELELNKLGLQAEASYEFKG